MVYAERVPLAKGATLDLALHGGEDYELLFTTAPRRRVAEEIAGVRVTRLGEIIRGGGAFICDRDGRRMPLPPRGWEHFR